MFEIRVQNTTDSEEKTLYKVRVSGVIRLLSVGFGFKFDNVLVGYIVVEENTNNG